MALITHNLHSRLYRNNKENTELRAHNGFFYKPDTNKIIWSLPTHSTVFSGLKTGYEAKMSNLKFWILNMIF